jgi:tetratricopeptide (TPR) repeat protein
VKGQEDGADIVGDALAHSIVAGVSGVRNLDATVAGSAGVGTTHTLTGVLDRSSGGARLSVRLRDEGEGKVIWESGEREVGDDLSRAASELGREVVGALGLVYPNRYPYISEFAPGERLAASPLYAEYLEAGDGGHTLETCARLVREFPDDPAALVLHAWALMLTWDAAPNEATLAELRERLIALDRVDPSSPYDDLIRAYVYRSSGEPGQARVVYSWVLDGTDLTPAARAWALRQRALAGLQIGDAESARRDAQEAATLDPSKPENHIALSKALEELGLLDEAADASRRALALASHWRHHQRLGLVYSRAGRFEPATEALRAACDLGESQEACANLAVILGRAGDETAARAAAEYAESLSGTPWGAYNLACYRSRSGDRVGAVRELRRALELGYADKLVTTDPDLDPLRDMPGFKEVAAEIEKRITTRRQQSSSIFPWQS